MSDETARESVPADAHAAAAEAFVDRARSRHGEDLVELYVFGSTVRGEATGRSSDVDVLVVLSDGPGRDAIADTLRDIAYDVMLEYGPLVELHILDEPTFERHRQGGNPFVRNVLSEGHRMPDGDSSGESAVEDQLRQAHQALSDAKGARDAELSDIIVVNRLYYACFHAARAALYDRGYSPTTHGGALTLFGSEIVAAGDAPRDRGRFLNELSELRQQADYGYKAIDEDVGELLRRTRRFVSEMESLCDSTD